MGAKLGIVTGTGVSPAEVWLREVAARLDLSSSPPVPLFDIGRTSSPIVLALGEDELRSTLSSFRGLLIPGTALVSTCSTVSLESIRSLVGSGPALFRAVITTGTEVGEGAVALAAASDASEEAVADVLVVLRSLGPVEIVAEGALAALEALATGAAAFLCAALEGLQDGAVRQGLPTDTARSFANQTALATALLLCDHAGSPADLKDQVASPGGTTIAALGVLEDEAVRGAFLRAVEAAAAEIRARQDAARPGVIE